jgi:hypothetical protein
MKQVLALALLLIAYTAAQSVDPVNVQVLNYALTLEHLEAAYYRDALNQFTVNDALAYGLTEQDYTYLQAVRDHEAEHVTTLTSVITSLGATPVQECTYAFPYGSNFTQFLAFAATLEGVGVSAYDGAIAMVNVPALATAGATIATVEARHAAYLNYITKSASPFPSSFDTPLNMTQILAIAGPLLKSCPEVNSQCNGKDGATACGSNGQCSFGVCICNTGFTGASCETAVVATTCAGSPTSTSAPSSTGAPTSSGSPSSSSSPSPSGENISGENNARQSSSTATVTLSSMAVIAAAVALL